MSLFSGCFPSVSSSASISWSVRLLEDPLVGASPSSQLRCASEDYLQPLDLRPQFRLLGPPDFDSAVHSALEATTDSAVSESQRLQSSRTVSKIGIGLPIASKLCHAAFQGSYVYTKTLADQIINNSPQQAPGSVQNCVSALQDHEPTIQSVPCSVAPKAQIKLTDIVNGTSWRECLDSAITEREKPGCCPALWSIVVTGFRLSL